MDDLVFTFDTLPFLNGIDKISRGFRLLKSAATGFFEGAKKGWNDFFNSTSRKQKQIRKQSAKTFGSGGILGMLGSVTKMLGPLALVLGGVMAVIKHIPEIGKSFKMAGNIIMRNLLWPLRKLLIPLLQKMLNWVRDHRAMFVKWGVAIANNFRRVANTVKSLIRLVKRFVQSFVNRFEQIFGKVTKKMGDIVNIMMFKITAVTEFLIMLLEPVFDKLGSIFATALAGVKFFFDGLIDGLGNVGPDLADLMASLERMLELFILSDKSSKSLFSTLYKIGNFIGKTLSVTLKLFAQGIDTIVTAMQALVQTITLLRGVRAGMTQVQLEEQKQKLKKIFGEFGERTIERKESIKETITGPNPRSSIIKSDIKFGDIKIEVTEGSAKQAGINFAKGVNDTLYKEFKDGVNDSILGVATAV